MTKTVSVKIPVEILREIPSRNVSEYIRQAVTEKLQRDEHLDWKPKTEFGRKLLKLREKYLNQGGELLDAEGIAEEVRKRRGGLA